MPPVTSCDPDTTGQRCNEEAPKLQDWGDVVVTSLGEVATKMVIPSERRRYKKI